MQGTYNECPVSLRGGEILSVYGKTFNFNGQSSDVFNLVLCDFDTPSPTKETGLNLTINKGAIIPGRPLPNFYTAQYTDVLKFQMSFIKCNMEPFSQNEYRQVAQWLHSPASYSLLYIEDDDTDDYHHEIEYFAKCTGLTEYGLTGTVYGFTATFECNAPYGFSPEEVTAFSSSTGHNAIISINNTSDETSQDYYPIVEIKCTSTGKVQITNNKYSSEIFTLEMNLNQQLNIDNRLGIIEDSLNLFDFSTDTNLNWLHLAPGINQITIIGNATGNIRCRYPRKVGI